MALDKALGLDRLSVEFYQRYRDIIGMDVAVTVEFFFATGKMLDSWKATFITLIPKGTNLKKAKDYKLISLCNVCCKIITKILVNKLN